MFFSFTSFFSETIPFFTERLKFYFYASIKKNNDSAPAKPEADLSLINF